MLEKWKENMAELRMSLSTLPLLPLEAVASHLDFSSLVSLANTNTAFAHLQPTEQFLTGQDFSLSGPRDGDFCPETYFEVEVVSRGLVAIKMDWEWRDQVNTLKTSSFPLQSIRVMGIRKVNCGCSW